MAGFSIDSAHIVRVLSRKGHTHRCTRCETRMLVKHASNLCVHCWNDLRTSSSTEPEAGAPLRVGGYLRPPRAEREVALEEITEHVLAGGELEGEPTAE